MNVYLCCTQDHRHRVTEKILAWYMPLPLDRLGLFSSFCLAVFTAALSGMLVNNNSTSKDTMISLS